MKIDSGRTAVTSSITNGAVDDIGLEVAKEAYSVIKASNAMVAVD